MSSWWSAISGWNSLSVLSAADTDWMARICDGMVRARYRFRPFRQRFVEPGTVYNVTIPWGRRPSALPVRVGTVPAMKVGNLDVTSGLSETRFVHIDSEAGPVQ